MEWRPCEEPGVERSETLRIEPKPAESRRDGDDKNMELTNIMYKGIRRLTLGRLHLALLPVLMTCLMTLASCSSEEINLTEQPGETVKPTYTIRLNVKVPTENVTRSETDNSKPGDSSEGELAGTYAENSLVSANVYFCQNNKVKLALESSYVAPAKDIISDSNGDYSIIIEIEDELDNFEKLINASDPQTYQLFVVGNVKQEDNTDLYNPNVDGDAIKIDSDLSVAVFSVSKADDDVIGDYGTSGHIMPLVNAEEFTVTIPAGSTTDVINQLFDRKETSKNLAWWDVKDQNSGNAVLNLERAVARIEYSPLSDSDLKEYNQPKPDVYYVPSVGNGKVLQLRLYSLTPFNVNKNSYLFRHTALGSTLKAWTEDAADDNRTLFGKEKGNNGYNWVASSDWNWGAATNAFDLFGRLFCNVLGFSKETEPHTKTYNVEDGVGTILVSELEKRNKPTNDNYYPWCYVTENTLPATSFMTPEEVTNYATGVAFKFVVLGNDGNPLVYNENQDNYPNGVTNSTEVTGMIEIDSNKENGYKWVRPEKDEKGHFYLTYIAPIVHNDAQDYNDSYPPMYYGVVRNNTYQIKVKSLNGLPFAEDPKSVFLKVEINVLSWAKHSVTMEW